MSELKTVPVLSPADELKASELLIQAETELRRIEDERKSMSVPMNKALKELNSKSKAVAAPFEAAKEAIQKVLSDYRCTPAVQEQIALRNRAEKKFRAYEKAGDVEGMQLASESVKELTALVPKSVRPDGASMVVRYRESLKLDAIGDLPDEFYIRVPDEKKIKEQIELLGSVPGVEHHIEYTAYCVEVDKEEV